MKEDIVDKGEEVKQVKGEKSKGKKKKKKGVHGETDNENIEKSSELTLIKNKQSASVPKENGDVLKEKKIKKKKLKRKLEDSTSDEIIKEEINKLTSKKKKRKKTLAEEDCSPSFDALWKFFEQELQKSLSAIEIEDLKPESNDWYLTEPEPIMKDKPENFSPYLKSVVDDWSGSCSQVTRKGSPLLLIVTSSAVRAVDVLRHTLSFRGQQCKTGKLFAKHFKVEEQVKYLNENVVHLAVGTPHRILTLIENGSLHVKRLKYLIVDWSWKDIKTRRIANMPDVKDHFLLLFQKHLFKQCQKGTLSVGLF